MKVRRNIAVSRTWIVVGLLVIVIAVAGVGYWWYTRPSAVSETESFRIAMIVTKALQDGSWNEWMYNGVKELEELEGVEVSYSEFVDVPDFPRVAGDYAKEGTDLILAHTNDYIDAAHSIAPDYPNTTFLVSAAFRFDEPNVAGFQVAPHEGYYLLGILAAKMTQTDTVGVIASFRYASQLINVNGFISGVWSVNENLTILTTFTGSWYDVSKSYEAAITIIEAGADWVTPIGSGNVLGAIPAAEEKDIHITGSYLDMNAKAPDNVVTSVVYSPYEGLLQIIDLVKAGELQPKLYNFKMAEGAVALAPYHGLEDEVPQEAKDAVEAAKAQIMLGTLEVPYIPNTLLTD